MSIKTDNSEFLKEIIKFEPYQREQQVEDTNNKNCYGCGDCNDCNECKHCRLCQNCYKCSNSFNLINCNQCLTCINCDNCYLCWRCNDQHNAKFMIDDVYWKPKAFIKKFKELYPNWDISLEWNNQSGYDEKAWADLLNEYEADEQRVDY